MSLGKQYVSAILAENKLGAFLASGDILHLFRPNELPFYDFVKSFVKAYGSLPKVETVETHLGDELIPHKEPSGYYLDLLETRYVEERVKSTGKAASDLLKPENKDPQAALQKMTDMVLDVALKKQQKNIVDFRNAIDLVLPAYLAKFKAESSNGLLYGWPYLDAMTGGVGVGDLVSFVGRPAQGKTWKLLYAALYGWNLAAKLAKAAASAAEKPEVMPASGSRMFVSMEMPAQQIIERLSAMQTHLPMNKLKHADLGTTGLKKLKAGLTEIKTHADPFWVVDGNLAATVEDIWLMARQLKPDAIFIDGGYLVKHPTEKDRFRRVAENADLMKQELSSMCPTTVSWQFAKSASKKKKGEVVTGDDVGYSDAIFQVSSILLGLFEHESVETLKRRCVQLIKGRSGETGQFITNWDFANMDFSEISEVAVEDLQFL